ncbi:hypothetical protein JW964_10230 [candidate division KSB1 bacterium]|nr:hypothetical protein [candidate division KSB1 bacterium]
MAYLIIDDEAPDALEYTNNYFYFNDKDPNIMKKILEIIQEFNKKNTEKNSRKLFSLLEKELNYV